MAQQNKNPKNQQDEMPLYTAVDDDLYDELSQLTGQKIVHVEVWEDSLSMELEGEEVPAGEQTSFDIDLYLADGAYFELYSATCYDSPDADPWQGVETVSERLTAARQGAVLQEVAVDEEDQLVLVLAYEGGKQLFLPVAAWLLEEWDELPGS